MIELHEDDLRRRLRDGRLSGLEPARPPGETAWRPLHSLPLFAQALPVRGDPVRLAHRRAARSWATHLVIFSGVCFALWVGAGHFPICGLYWLIPVTLHTLRTVPSLLALLRPAPTPEAPSELDQLIAALDASTADLEALQAEARTLELRISSEPSQRAAEALEAQLSALRDRIALMAEARVARVRLEAMRGQRAHEQAALALVELQEAATALARLRGGISSSG